MRATRSWLITCTFAALALNWTACGSGEPDVDPRVETLAELQGVREELAMKRGEVAALRARLAEVPEEAAEATADAVEGESDAEQVEPEVELNQAMAEVASMTDDFNGRLVDFINADPPVQGEPMNEMLMAAMRMKTAEDMLIAQEHIERGGDYRRAIDIYEQLLQVDPDNADLKAALEQAHADRYVTEERFELAKKGLTQQEIRDALGPPNVRNIRRFPEDKIEAWFYPREEGGAAGVWFRERRGEYTVYQTDFDAVKAPVEEES